VHPKPGTETRPAPALAPLRRLPDAMVARLTEHARHLDPDPIGPFEDYGWEDKDF
jgi:hypothetical protein